MELTPPSPEDPNDAADVRWLVRTALIFYGIVVLFAVGFSLFSLEIKTLFGEKFPHVGALLAGIGVGLVIVALTRVGFRSVPGVARAAREFSRMLGPLGKRDALILAGVSSVAEELLFRGALWQSLDLAGTTCLFALVHVIPKKSLWGYPLFALLAGLLLGLLREGTGSVIPCMIAHFVVNALNLYWIGKKHAEWTAPPEPAPVSTPEAASSVPAPVAEPDAGA